MTDDQIPELKIEHFYELVAERGEDFTYVPPADPADPDGEGQSCYYFDPVTEEKSCGIGWILDGLGFGPDDVTEFRDAGNVIDDLVRSGRLKLGHPQARVLAHKFQAQQDKGVPYLEALKEALRKLRIPEEKYDPRATSSPPKKGA